MGFIKNLLSSIWAFLSNLLPFGNKNNPQLASASRKGSEKPQSNQNNGSGKEPAMQVKEAAKQASTQVKETAAQASLFLSGDDARGYKSSNGKSSNGKLAEAKPELKAEKPNSNQTAATASAFNLAKPKVTTYADFNNSGDRRLPGANMSDFLKMARQMKTKAAK